MSTAIKNPAMSMTMMRKSTESFLFLMPSIGPHCTIKMGDSESGVFDSSIPNGIVLVSNEKLESFETIPN